MYSSVKTSLTLSAIIMIVACVIGALKADYDFKQKYDPGPSVPYLMKGNFYRSALASYTTGKDSTHHNWIFELKMSPSEMDKVRAVFGWADIARIYKEEGNERYGRGSRGDWCGLLPLENDLVVINSPTGFTRDVEIIDLDTLYIYKNTGDCQLPTPK